MGPEDKFVGAFLDDEIVDRHVGQVAVQRGKRRSTIRCDIRPAIGAHDPPTLAVRAFHQGIDRLVGQELAPIAPRLSLVSGGEHEGVETIVPVAIECNHEQFWVVTGPCHFADPKVPGFLPLSQSRGEGETQLLP